MLSVAELVEMEKRVGFADGSSKAFDSTEAKFNAFLLENEHVPLAFAEKFWAFFEKEMALTNLEREDVKGLMTELDIAVLNWKMGHPHFETTQDDIMNLDMLRAKLFIRAMRSTGGISRERAIEATQIRQILGGESSAPQGGIMSAIANALPGKKNR